MPRTSRSMSPLEASLRMSTMTATPSGFRAEHEIERFGSERQI